MRPVLPRQRRPLTVAETHAPRVYRSMTRNAAGRVCYDAGWVVGCSCGADLDSRPRPQSKAAAKALHVAHCAVVDTPAPADDLAVICSACRNPTRVPLGRRGAGWPKICPACWLAQRTASRTAAPKLPPCERLAASLTRHRQAVRDASRLLTVGLNGDPLLLASRARNALAALGAADTAA